MSSKLFKAWFVPKSMYLVFLMFHVSLLALNQWAIIDKLSFICDWEEAEVDDSKTEVVLPSDWIIQLQQDKNMR